MSWYGTQEISINLGGAFHSKRLKLIASQVGKVSPSRRARWSYSRRMAKAIALLDDPRLDVLVKDIVDFDDVAAQLPKILGQDNLELPPVIRYASGAD